MHIFRYILPAVLLLSIPLSARAQKQERITLSINRNETLPAKLERTQRTLEAESKGSRGLVSLGIGLASNVGTRALFQLIDKADARHSASWSVPEGRGYFYESPSFLGPMDPTGMHFSGITLLREEHDSESNMGTAMLVKLSLPEDRLDEYVTSRRFDLQIDTLMVDLSRVKARYTGKKVISIQISIGIRATWMDEKMDIHKNQELGVFNICLQNLKYVPEQPVVAYSAEQAKNLISGSCFFIPRSYSAFVYGSEYKDCWSAGEFEVTIQVTENAGNKKSKNAEYVRQYLENALPGAVQQLLTNEQLAGSMVVNVVKNY